MTQVFSTFRLLHLDAVLKNCGTGAGGFQPGNTCQRQARAGGEIGQNGEFYLGGQFLPSTDMPKRIRDEMKRIGAKKTKIDDGLFEVLEPGEFAPFSMIGTHLQFNRERNQVELNNDSALAYLGLDKDSIQDLQEIAERFNAGERKLSIFEYPKFAKGEDIVRASNANMPINEGLRSRLVGGLAKYIPYVTENGQSSNPKKSLNLLRPVESAPIDKPRWSCVMLILPSNDADVVRQMQASIEPDDILELEDNPHITVKYGLDTIDPDEVACKLDGTGPVTVSIGTSTLFESTEQDVLKLNVSGDGLMTLNQRLCELLHIDTHATYLPHVTIAYLKPGTGKKYIDKFRQLNGRELTFDECVFSDKNKAKTVIGLDGSIRKSDADDVNRSAHEILRFLDNTSDQKPNIIGCKSVFRSQWFDDEILKNCGANAPGGGGFQPGNTCASGGSGSTPTRVMFEVAPDPNDKELHDRWNNLSESEKLEISKEVVDEIFDDIFESSQTEGTIASQFGGYLDDTNPSFAAIIDSKEEAAKVADLMRLAGFTLSQDSVMSVSATPIEGSSPAGFITIQLPENLTVEEVHDIYSKARKATGIEGHTTVGTEMLIVDFTGNSKQIASDIDNVLGGKFEVGRRDGFATFINKKDYGYASNRGEGAEFSRRRENAANLRRKATHEIEKRIQRIEDRRNPRQKSVFRSFWLERAVTG